MIIVLIICLCLALNAVFASIEMAFVTIRRKDLSQRAQKGSKNALRLLQLRETPERALSVIQIGITLVGAVSAAVGGSGAGEKLAPLLMHHFSINKALAETVSIAIIVVPLTYLSVVVGELVPKTIALRYPQAVLKFGASVLIVGSRVLGPVVSIFEGSTRLILKVVLRSAPPATSAHDAEPDVDFADLEQHQRQYILNLVGLKGRKIKDVCHPWEDALCVNHDERFGQILPKVIESGHTRLPVLGDNGTVLGILHTKEFLAFVDSGNTDWQSIIRSAPKVRPEDDLLNVLRHLQNKKQHMAIVMRGGEQVGLVTVEDILEEIVGEIFDEDDDGWVQKILNQRSQASASKAKAIDRS